MNRDIEFRGKIRDDTGKNDGKWVFGYFYYDQAEDCGFHCHIWSKEGSFSDYVHEETVGEFTGLLDKNGVKIFEGDILHFKGIVNCLVAFVDGQFVIYNIRPFTALKIKMQDYGECEVIGNIHDNPELLEGTK